MTQQPTTTVAIAGAGIGGLAAALACARAGCAMDVFDQAQALSEAGAGIQLGPNVTRVLDTWGLGAALRRVAAQPQELVVRDAARGIELGRMHLGQSFAQRYGAPYLTLHRADLQELLLHAALDAGARLRLHARVNSIEVTTDRVRLIAEGIGALDADGAVAADGVWSALRANVVDDGPAKASGHVAYRALIAAARLPAHLRRDDVKLWLGPSTHVVAYPVRGGELFNVVAIVEAHGRSAFHDWDESGLVDELLRAMGSVDEGLRALIDVAPSWRVWSLHDRPPLAGAHAMARGRVALLGDAAHPMLPYLAQGAGMAIEDADALARTLADASSATVPEAFARYAQARWQRCAQVQARARRNAAVFHASGPLRWARDAAMRTLGERLLDQPWLYAR